jgi:hypothetical protein
MKTQHTKGEWEPIYSTYPQEPKKICTGVGIVTRFPGGDYTEFICNSMLPDTDEEYIEQRNEIEANMRLIAAAPDMLEALIEAKRMYEEVQPCGGWQGVYEQIESAIKKATE